MNGFAIERILARPGHGLDAAQQLALRRMADYLDRNSLRIVWDDGGCGAALEIHVSNDAERLALTVAELQALWEGMRNGKAVDWASLRRVERR
jgi:hypothetical protein